MIISRGNLSVMISNHMTDEFEFLMQGAAAEGAGEYSNLTLGTKYEYSVVQMYNDIPYGFFLMCNGGRYAPNVMRVFTKLYTIPQFRSSGDSRRFMIDGDTPTSVAIQSHKIIANFVEDILPEADIKPYDFYFYSRVPGDTPIISLMNKYATVKWSLSDKLYFVGKKQSDSRSWKHIVYKGDLSQFTQPSQTI